MARDMMTGTLLGRATPPSEVLLNINVEAVARHGGYLQRGVGGAAEIKPGLAAAAGCWRQASSLDIRSVTLWRQN